MTWLKRLLLVLPVALIFQGLQAEPGRAGNIVTIKVDSDLPLATPKPAATATATPVPAPAPAAPVIKDVRVEFSSGFSGPDAVASGAANTDATAPGFGNGDTVFVTLSKGGRAALRREAKDKPILLYLAERPLVGIPARDALGADDLMFHLAFDATNRRAWQELCSGGRLARPIKLAVGIEGGTALASYDKAFQIQVPLQRKVLALTLLVCLAVLTWWSKLLSLGWLRDARDQGKDYDSLPPTYSLGKVQLAAWSVVCASAWLWIWVATGEAATPNQTFFWLLGVAVGTTGVSKAITTGQQAQPTKSSGEQPAPTPSGGQAPVVPALRRRDLPAMVGATGPTPPVEAAPRLPLTPATALETRVAQAPAPADSPTVIQPTSGNLLVDVMNTPYPDSVHRVQFVYWNLALMGVFLAFTWNSLTFPDFDAALLVLAGISSGTYLALKTQEQA